MNIGWLDRLHRFEKGSVPEEFLDGLWKYLRYPVQVARGFHICEFCKQTFPMKVPVIQYKGKKEKQVSVKNTSKAAKYAA